MYVLWPTKLLIFITLKNLIFIAGATTLRANEFECPQGDFVSLEPVLSQDSFPVLNSSIHYANVSSSVDCLEVCKNTSCIYAYHQASTNACFVQPKFLPGHEYNCQSEPIRNVLCDNTDLCTRIVRRCRKCGHQSLSAVINDLQCNIDASNSPAEFCKHAEKAPVGCPFGHRLEFIDYNADLRQAQATLGSHFVRQDGGDDDNEDLSNRQDCFERCKRNAACSAAFHHESSGMCFLAQMTASTAAKLCRPAMQTVVTQLACAHPGECSAMMKVCENCGAAVTVDNLYRDADCEAVTNLTDWCHVRSRFVCQINPTARFCPMWIKKIFLRHATSLSGSSQALADPVLLYGKPNSVQTANEPELSIALIVDKNKTAPLAHQPFQDDPDQQQRDLTIEKLEDSTSRLKSQRIPDPEPLYRTRSGGYLNKSERHLNLR